MQTQVMFYLLDNVSDNVPDNTLDNDLADAKSATQELALHACYLAAKFYRNNQRVFIYTEDQQSAHNIDELLWAFEPESFVAHNLAGEGPINGAAVEISWQAPTNRRPILINLTSTVPNFANQYSQIIDFVPTDETLKQQARDRFRTCRQWGFQVDNQPIPVDQKTTMTHS